MNYKIESTTNDLVKPIILFWKDVPFSCIFSKRNENLVYLEFLSEIDSFVELTIGACQLNSINVINLNKEECIQVSQDFLPSEKLVVTGLPNFSFSGIQGTYFNRFIRGHIINIYTHQDGVKFVFDELKECKYLSIHEGFYLGINSNGTLTSIILTNIGLLIN